MLKSVAGVVLLMMALMLQVGCGPSGPDIARVQGTVTMDGKPLPNAIIMSANVFNRIQRSTLMQNQIFGVVPKSAGQFTLPGEDDVARALGVDNLYVAKAAKNGNAKGQTFSGSFIFADTYVSVCQVMGGEYQSGGIGRSILWSKDTTGLFTPETYRSDERRSNIIRVRQHVAEKIVDETAGEHITTSFA
jgi:hypothetical protein